MLFISCSFASITCWLAPEALTAEAVDETINNYLFHMRNWDRSQYPEGSIATNVNCPYAEGVR
jgi:hypothetical protein